MSMEKEEQPTETQYRKYIFERAVFKCQLFT